MRLAQGWKDYELVACRDGQRLERWGMYTLVRPDPVVVWKNDAMDDRWGSPDAVYHRSPSGGGGWEMRRRIPDEWTICWDSYIRLYVTPTGFKHTGVFPEQAANWAFYRDMITATGRPVRVLNLFAYTGAATAVCLKAGASVCHVDASKGMVSQAKRNVALNGLADADVRYIVEDCVRFVEREQRRRHVYDAIILDPPSYGRGPSGELWKMEDMLYDLLVLCRGLLCKNPLFLSLNTYTSGLSVGVMQYLCGRVLGGVFATTDCDEIGVAVSDGTGALACGVSTLLYN